LLQEQYNPTTNELIEHTSVNQLTAEKVNEASSITSLEDCLFKFHKREELENTLHCRGCQGQQLHTKRLDIF
jgi:ubiquitin C-terminal hydrolase